MYLATNATQIVCISHVPSYSLQFFPSCKNAEAEHTYSTPNKPPPERITAAGVRSGVSGPCLRPRPLDLCKAHNHASLAANSLPGWCITFCFL